MSFCAICTDEIKGDVIKEPLGKKGALVIVCTDCSNERPVDREPQQGYQCRDDVEPVTGFKKRPPGFKRAVAKAEKRIVPKNHVSRNYFRDYANVHPVTPGFVVELIRRSFSDGRRSLTTVECKALAEAQPWFGPDVRYLGSGRQHAVFERPDPGNVKRIRHQEVDVLAVLRGHEVE